MSYRDPTADELVQRFRLTSTSSLNSTGPKRPSLTLVKRGSSVIRAATDANISIAYSLNRNCVSSLHQNGRTSLLYGKNNVTVANEGTELKGYLSLHQETNRLTLKWMANAIMNANSQPDSGPGSPTKHDPDNSQLWKNTIIINIQTIIYIHLHQQDANSQVSLVFVDAEGVQHRPFQFPPGQHCVAFLACLEGGLGPTHKLDPPLHNEPGIGKILPQIKPRRSSLLRRSTDSSDESNINSPEKHDYVFRIRKSNQSFGMQPMSAALNEFVQQNGGYNSVFQSNSLPNSPALLKRISEKTRFNETSKSVQRTVTKSNTTDATTSSNSENHSQKDSITDACQLMRQQIISRAFYGWLIYSKHMKTIRTHLACTIDSQRLEEQDDAEPVDELLWKTCRKLKTKEIHREFLIRCYFKGVKQELRPQVWPYLLQLIPWEKEIEDYLPKWKEKYQQEVDGWAELEAEVVRRDCEQFQMARLRQSSNIEDYKNPPMRDNSTCSEVFDNNSPTTTTEVEKSEKEKLIEDFGTNLHRIEKDVERCDRHTEFFSERDHLDSLKRIMCTYVMRHLDDGYVQGMCDIAAPLLVIFKDEVLTLECFELMMERMKDNFPHGNGIEQNLTNLRSIVSVMDVDLHFQLMNDTDYTHLYFAYRWFLLDFKREFIYEDVFLIWEVIWSSAQLVSKKFQLFFAFALLTQYREILLENNMDFTDVIKFYNEMAEKHNVNELLKIAREKLRNLQELTNANLLTNDNCDVVEHE